MGCEAAGFTSGSPRSNTSRRGSVGGHQATASRVCGLYPCIQLCLSELHYEVIDMLPYDALPGSLAEHPASDRRDRRPLICWQLQEHGQDLCLHPRQRYLPIADTERPANNVENSIA